MGLGGGGADDEALGDLVVAEPVSDESHHLALAGGQLIEQVWARGRGLGTGCQLGDQVARDGRREERFSSSEALDRTHELGRNPARTRPWLSASSTLTAGEAAAFAAGRPGLMRSRTAIGAELAVVLMALAFAFVWLTTTVQR